MFSWTARGHESLSGPTGMHPASGEVLADGSVAVLGMAVVPVAAPDHDVGAGDEHAVAAVARPGRAPDHRALDDIAVRADQDAAAGEVRDQEAANRVPAAEVEPDGFRARPGSV